MFLFGFGFQSVGLQKCAVANLSWSINKSKQVNRSPDCVACVQSPWTLLINYVCIARGRRKSQCGEQSIGTLPKISIRCELVLMRRMWPDTDRMHMIKYSKSAHGSMQLFWLLSSWSKNSLLLFASCARVCVCVCVLRKINWNKCEHVRVIIYTNFCGDELMFVGVSDMVCVCVRACVCLEWVLWTYPCDKFWWWLMAVAESQGAKNGYKCARCRTSLALIWVLRTYLHLYPPIHSRYYCHIIFHYATRYPHMTFISTLTHSKHADLNDGLFSVF